jgi:hypothetical protein
VGRSDQRHKAFATVGRNPSRLILGQQVGRRAIRRASLVFAIASFPQKGCPSPEGKRACKHLYRPTGGSNTVSFVSRPNVQIIGLRIVARLAPGRALPFSLSFKRKDFIQIEGFSL